MEEEILKNYEKAIDISNQVIEYTKSIEFTNKKILDIAQEIEGVIKVKGGKPAWPINISINEIAAHYTPDINDPIILKEDDLVKVDIGVHVDGYICDKAFTVCVGKKTHPLIETAEKTLQEALKLFKPGTKIFEISELVENTVNQAGFNVIRNLGGHRLERFQQHAHPSIPNGKNTIKDEIEAGNVYAMEVFTTNGSGWVIESSPTLIFQFNQDVRVRLYEARKVLERAVIEFQGLPFCKRWLKDISPIKLEFALRQLSELEGIIEFPPLREEGNGLVAVAEDTVIVK
jgi:methionyl aminopeptidase